jgi:hypothetical protein
MIIDDIKTIINPEVHIEVMAKNMLLMPFMVFLKLGKTRLNSNRSRLK